MNSDLDVHQSRRDDPTPYENKLAGAIEEVFSGGAFELDALVAGLNDLGFTSPSGDPWTATSFTNEMQRMGA